MVMMMTVDIGIIIPIDIYDDDGDNIKMLSY